VNLLQAFDTKREALAEVAALADGNPPDLLAGLALGIENGMGRA